MYLYAAKTDTSENQPNIPGMIKLQLKLWHIGTKHRFNTVPVHIFPIVIIKISEKNVS